MSHVFIKVSECSDDHGCRSDFGDRATCQQCLEEFCILNRRDEWSGFCSLKCFVIFVMERIDSIQETNDR